MSVSILTQHSVGHNKQHVVLDLAAFTVCVSAVTSRGKLHTRSVFHRSVPCVYLKCGFWSLFEATHIKNSLSRVIKCWVLPLYGPEKLYFDFWHHCCQCFLFLSSTYKWKLYIINHCKTQHYTPFVAATEYLSPIVNSDLSGRPRLLKATIVCVGEDCEFVCIQSCYIVCMCMYVILYSKCCCFFSVCIYVRVE